MFQFTGRFRRCYNGPALQHAGAAGAESIRIVGPVGNHQPVRPSIGRTRRNPAALQGRQAAHGASADQPITLDISIDGKPQPPVTVQASRLYTLFDSSDYREHSLILRIPQSGLRVYSFTFG
jgi:hypothetical protein